MVWFLTEGNPAHINIWAEQKACLDNIEAFERGMKHLVSEAK